MCAGEAAAGPVGGECGGPTGAVSTRSHAAGRAHLGQHCGKCFIMYSCVRRCYQHPSFTGEELGTERFSNFLGSVQLGEE